jgi:hypothetical protein
MNKAEFKQKYFAPELMPSFQSDLESVIQDEIEKYKVDLKIRFKEAFKNINS